MRKRIIPLGIFLVLSAFFVVFSSKVSTPFDFITYLSSSPRAFLYAGAHAQTKPTELDLLKQENIALRVKLVKLDALQKDNDALRNQFEDTMLSSQTLLPAKVVGASGTSISPTVLILDQGAKSNVKSGMAAVLGHILLGKIGIVTPWNCQLILVTSKNFSTLGVISENNSSGVVSGEDDFILFDNVVITDSLTKEETVVTKGEVDKAGVGIPPDLIVGKITTINKSDSSPFQSAFIKPLVNFEKLTTVFIVTK